MAGGRPVADSQDPHCPECGEPIGQTATYCMHCSADLSDEKAAADTNDDGTWDRGAGSGEGDPSAGDEGDASPTYDPLEDAGGDAAATTDTGGQVLDPDGIVDNTLTVIVGILGGIVVGIVATITLAIVTESLWGVLLGIVAWLGSTGYLVRRRTVQGAVEKSGYAAAVVLLLIPLVAFSPLASVEGGLAGRGSFFLVALVVVSVPAGIAAVVGWIAGRFAPDSPAESEG